MMNVINKPENDNTQEKHREEPDTEIVSQSRKENQNSQRVQNRKKKRNSV